MELRKLKLFRRSVCFIDDDLDLLEFFDAQLKSTNLEVHCFSTHRETLDQIEEIFPGVIFIDYQMTEGNGIHLLNQLKALCPHSKKIILTGEGNEMIAVKAMKAGADDYLVKPILPDDLMRVIEEYLEDFFSIIIKPNGKYYYPLDNTSIARYEFLRAAYSNISKSIKSVCKFFSYSRQDFYNYDRRFRAFGPVGLLKKKDFEKLPNRYSEPHPSPRKIKTFEDFIDQNDDVQIKLEMMREAATSTRPNICDISAKYGFTREAFYQIYRKFQESGINALTEKKKGRPRQNP